MSHPLDILVLSNGPGEVTTWVRPVVAEIRRQLPQARISVVLSPCPHASGREADIVDRYPEVDRVQAAERFWDFLLWGKTADDWDWHDRGVVLFLGGDRLFPVLLGRRLGYRIVLYAEWEAQWAGWVDRVGMATPAAIARAPRRHAAKLYAVGNLMADVGGERSGSSLDGGLDSGSETRRSRIGFLPGSKPLKLSLGVPLTLEIADRLDAARPDLELDIFVAPTLNRQQLAEYADPACNPAIAALNWTSAQLDGTRLQTPRGTALTLRPDFPAYDRLIQCDLCITTVGANTAELAALGVPMLVLLPTHRLDVMRAWDGIPGILANLPGVGDSFTRLFTWLAWQWLDRRAGGSQLAWANIWAGEAIVPEFLGRFPPDQIARAALDLLENPQKRRQMQENLRRVCGTGGAAEKLVRLLNFDEDAIGDRPRFDGSNPDPVSFQRRSRRTSRLW